MYYIVSKLNLDESKSENDLKALQSCSGLIRARNERDRLANKGLDVVIYDLVTHRVYYK